MFLVNVRYSEACLHDNSFDSFFDRAIPRDSTYNLLMALDKFFQDLINKVEAAPEISNQSTDKNGFYKPRKTIVLRHLHLLRDLHAKPMAKEMLKSSWRSIAEELPPEWLIPDPEDRETLKKILS